MYKRHNQIGEPTGQTHAVLFMDYDKDGDQDIWIANDGDRIHLFRNDSVYNNIEFKDISALTGIDIVGAWMGFAVADYDGDTDLDVFITNMGFHPRTRKPRQEPSGSCEYHEQFVWGTCLHFFLENNRLNPRDGTGPMEVFTDITQEIGVIPSPYMPPRSLDPSNIHADQEQPLGLGAYEFGFGATFFDYDNDGDIDILVANMDSPPTLLRNETASTQNWLIIQVENRSVIGVKVVVQAKNSRQVREGRSGSSYASQNNLRFHFGLGKNTEAELVKITWPNGRVSELANVTANQILKIDN